MVKSIVGSFQARANHYQDRKAKAGEPFVATDNNEYNALDKADCRGPEAVPATLSEWATIRPGRPIFRQRDSSGTAVARTACASVAQHQHVFSARKGS